MVKHLIHQDDSFSHQQIFLEPGKVLDIKYIIVEKKKTDTKTCPRGQLSSR